MKINNSNLDQFSKENPFKVPEGYMEGLTSQIMSQLPDKQKAEETKQISIMDRVRPWLYLAAVFAGLGLFFRAIVGIYGFGDGQQQADSLLVHNLNSPSSYTVIQEESDYYDEDEEYLEYIESQYASYILAEEIDFSE